MKQDLFEELYPKDHGVAFYPKNCLILEAEDNLDDNLFKCAGQVLSDSKTNTHIEATKVSEYYIFTHD